MRRGEGERQEETGRGLSKINIYDYGTDYGMRCKVFRVRVGGLELRLQ
jgi:hypothetical protein